ALLSILLLPALLTLAVLRQLLLHLPLQLFRLAPQHLLLPPLLEALLRITLLIGQILLPLGQSVEFRKRIFHILCTLLRGRCSLRRLVLVLLRIQFQVEQTGQVPACTVSAAASPATLLAKGNRNLPVRRLCPDDLL